MSDDKVEGFTIEGDHVALFGALAKAQARFLPIVRDKTVKVQGKKKDGTPFSYSFEYAPLESVLAAILPALNENGLALIQPFATMPDGSPFVQTILLHEKGGLMSCRSLLSRAGDMKEMGGQVTYIRRYMLSMLGVSPEDDDDGSAFNGEEREMAPKRSQARQDTPRRGPPPLPAQAAKAPPAKEEPAKTTPVAPAPTQVTNSAPAPEATPPGTFAPEPDFHVEDGPRTLVDEEQDGPASKDLKLSIRVAMMALHLSPPEVVRKLAQWFPGVPMPKIAESKVKSQQLLDMLMADVELVPGLVQRLPEIRSEQLK